jgi:nucleotide-binding universal stress UspA family protein
MGTHGRKHLAQLALGSVAKEVLRHATIPVFAVGPHAHKMAGRETPKKILHPVSLVGQYAESVDFAIEVAQIHGAQLHLLHVLASDLEANSDPGQSLDWAEDAMSALVPAEPHSIPPVETSATFGDVIREILFAAAVADADWIVMGVHCNCPFWPLNSNTAYRVLAEANCPVLTIPHDPYRTLNLAENLKGIEIPGSTPQEKSQEGRAPLAARVELRPIN